MKKILILGGYGTVGSLAAQDLTESGFFVGIAGRNSQKVEALRKKLGENRTEGHILDVTDTNRMQQVLQKYDIVLNCAEYTINETVLQSCIQAKKHYIDLGDYYEGIITSRSYDQSLKDSHIFGILGAGSAPGIINVMIAHVTKSKEKVREVVISFSDISKNIDEKMLPFNFQTVVEEITGEALIFENGEYQFVPGATKSMGVDFGNDFGKAECYMTNHDEQYSIPLFLQEKGIKNCYFVMNHNPLYLKLIPAMKELGFFEDTPVKIGDTEVRSKDFVQTFMKQYLPNQFSSEDTEILFAKIDSDTIGVINKSVDGIPAGIVNTAIGASLITQYAATHSITPGIHHPEDCIDSQWIIDELKKRNFILQLNGKKI